LKVTQAEKNEIVKNIFNPKKNVNVDDFIITEVNENFTDKSPSCISGEKNEDEMFLCIKCFTRNRDCCFMECGHIGYCWNCILDMGIINELPGRKNRKLNRMKKLTTPLTCPICKVDNDQILLLVTPY